MAENNKTKYSHRFLARIVIEAKTPLAVGSGEKGALTGALVALDANGLPYIPATSLAGVFRSFFSTLDSKPTDESQMAKHKYAAHSDKIFGNTEWGSEIIFSEAKIIDSTGKVIDGRDLTALSTDPLLQHYIELPIHQHVRLSEKGVADDSGKYDEQVVYAGTRFCFEIEMISDGQNFKDFKTLLCSLFESSFRIGGGTRRGFGEMTVESVQLSDLDFNKKKDLIRYLNKTSALNSDFWTDVPNQKDKLKDLKSQSEDFLVIELALTPESFFLFGSGFGDDEVDMTPVKAKKVEWSSDDKGLHGKMQENLVLIPASSVKGAIAHRVAFHWNRLNKVYADHLTPDGITKATGKHNVAVRILFGSEGDNNEKGITRGNIIFSDIIEETLPDKIFNHVAIDRFTGGAIEGALFHEKATYGPKKKYKTSIILDMKGIHRACNALLGENANGRQKIMKAFDASLDDLCRGMLPLGGMVNKGYGVFTGEYKPKPVSLKDGEDK